VRDEHLEAGAAALAVLDPDPARVELGEAQDQLVGARGQRGELIQAQRRDARLAR